jgi:hypothetical protein
MAEVGDFKALLRDLVSILITIHSVEQAGGAAAKHSTRRTASVKKCVNSI